MDSSIDPIPSKIPPEVFIVPLSLALKYLPSAEPRGKLAEAIVEAGGDIDGYIDTFNLLRRPGWCHEKGLNAR